MSIFKKDILCEKLKRLGALNNSNINKMMSGYRAYASEQKVKFNGELDLLNEIVDENSPSFEKLFLEMDLIGLDDSLKISNELSIIGLYRSLELRMLHIIETVFEDSNRRELYRFFRLKKYLKERNINIEEIACYSTMNELRLINNSLKHGGVVSKELAQYPGWIEGNVLTDLEDFYDDASSKLPLFIEHFVILLEEEFDCYTMASEGLEAELNL